MMSPYSTLSLVRFGYTHMRQCTWHLEDVFFFFW